MRQLLFSVLFSVMTFFSGLRKEAPVTRVVTQIAVTAWAEEASSRYVYTDERKMSIMLGYLRGLDPYFPVEFDPDTFRAHHYEITVSYSDGSATLYRQISRDYLQENSGPWERIDTGRASRLPLILRVLPSDII